MHKDRLSCRSSLTRSMWHRSGHARTNLGFGLAVVLADNLWAVEDEHGTPDRLADGAR